MGKTKVTKSKADLIREYDAQWPGSSATDVGAALGMTPNYVSLIRRLDRKRNGNAPKTRQKARRGTNGGEVGGRQGSGEKTAQKPDLALEVQVGGDHYKRMAIQPAVFSEANKLSFLEGCVVKRICRWRAKDGLRDLEKAKHEIDLLIQMEQERLAKEGAQG